MNITEKSKKIKEFANEIGFDNVGIVKADFLNDEKENLANWLNNGYNADMQYLENNFDKRLDPRLLVENAKSVIVVIKNYFPENQQLEDTFKVSKYSYNDDYHTVIKNNLHKLFNFINTEIQPVKGRIFVDSAPVLEKAWAKKAGLGWIGKNSLLLTKKGSFFFIGEIVIDIELDYEVIDYKSFCGNCIKCIDACPTNAIVKPYIVDSNKCISYQTIENKGEIDISLKGKFENWIFGCDICQDVCPWNKFSEPTSNQQFKISDLLQNMSKKDWKNLTVDEFNNIFKGSAVKRTKYEGLMRNINFAEQKS
ncbi:MAG: tRNA epoxyqueuosine(34) reductase QueG [Bacteroidales bacterium]|nr:tRNA epoxyqueuosine(34) reductase QueG [Bacteroidales bacterium]